MDDIFRLLHGREIDVGGVDAEQRIADDAADEANIAVRGAQCGGQLRQPLAAQERGIRRDHAIHCSLRDRLTIIAAVAPQMR